VVVTGGTGLIGSRLVEALEARGDEAYVVSRSAEGEKVIQWDPLEPDSITLLASASIFPAPDLTSAPARS